MTEQMTLAATVWPRALSPGERALRGGVLALAATLVLTISAKVQVPFYPVPLTLQTLAVLVIGAAFGTRLAAVTVGLYLLEGLLGLPVFAGMAAGPAYFAGPTGGFLLGFMVAAVFVGWTAERGWHRNLWALALIMTVGHALIFACGFAGLFRLMGPQAAWLGGVAPFGWATLLKTGLAVAVVPALWRLARRAKS